MSDIRTLTTANDFGPPTVTRTRLSRDGLGARLIVKGNPFSFTVDSLTPCIPFLSLAGSKSPQSNAVRDALIAEGDPTGGTTNPTSPSDNGTTNNTTNDPTTPKPGSGSGGDGGGHYASTGGPFGYVNASSTGHR